MARKPTYTEEQVKEFLANPYTHYASIYRLKFTLEFKQFFMEQREIPGMTTRKILQKAGYNPDAFSNTLCGSIAKNIVIGK